MEVNMPDIAGPIGLLKCVAAVKQLHSGDRLSVIVRDEDIYAALVKILEKDAGCCLVLNERPEGHLMRVTRI